jgi:hypothetical protein
VSTVITANGPLQVLAVPNFLLAGRAEPTRAKMGLCTPPDKATRINKELPLLLLLFWLSFLRLPLSSLCRLWPVSGVPLLDE